MSDLDGTKFALRGEFGFAFSNAAHREEAEMTGDEDMNDSFESGVGAMEQREQERTENMLLETEFKLFEEHYTYEEELIRQKAANARKGNEENYRYYSMGYSANVDQVDDLEISLWQSRFPHLHAVGLGEEPHQEQEGFSCPSKVDSDSNNSESGDDAHLDLCIIGTKAAIFESCGICEETGAEIIVEDGCLEEIIAIHREFV